MMKLGLSLCGAGMMFWFGAFITLILTMASTGPVPSALLGMWMMAAILFFVAGLIVTATAAVNRWGLRG